MICVYKHCALILFTNDTKLPITLFTKISLYTGNVDTYYLKTS